MHDRLISVPLADRMRYNVKGRKEGATMQTEAAMKKNFVYRSVFADIVRGKYTATSLITEKQLIDKYGISKSPVRDALVQLCADDIIESLPRIGYRVKPVSMKDIRDALILRKMVERTSLEMAFSKIGEEQLHTLQALYEESQKEEFTQKDPYIHWELNARFHITLCTFSGNRFFTRTLDNLMKTCFRGITSYYEDTWKTGSDKDRSEWHKILVDAIRSKDYQKARHALEMDLAELDTYFLKNDTVLSSSFIIS